MIALGSLRHGKVHRKQADHLRVALAKPQLWCISISQTAMVLRRPYGFVIPDGADIRYMRGAWGSLNLMVKTQPGTLMQFDRSLPRGVTAERIE